MHAAQNGRGSFQNTEAAIGLSVKKGFYGKRAESTPNFCGLLCESRVASALLFFQDPINRRILWIDLLNVELLIGFISIFRQLENDPKCDTCLDRITPNLTWTETPFLDRFYSGGTEYI